MLASCTSCMKMIVPLIEKDLEIIVVKIFSWFAQTTKIKKHEIYFTTDNHYSENISVSFTAQVASYFACNGLFFDTSSSLKLMANV